MAGATAIIELDAQYRQMREECGLLARSGRGLIEVGGAEAGEYLQGQLTNDVEALAPGQWCYAALLDRKGHLQADMRVLRRSDAEFWLDTEEVALAAVLRHLDTYRIGREVEVADCSGSRAMLSLIGPRSAEVAGAVAAAEHGSEEVEVGGAVCMAIATREGIDLCCGAAAVPTLREALLQRGAVEVSEDAAEILRIEAGVPRFGFEMNSSTMPAEAGIVEAAVNFEKGCYIGQETVARLHYRGRSNRHLRGLRLEAPAAVGAPLLLDEREVGTIGSFCVSPAQGPIGLAILRREAEPGATLTVDGGGRAEVVELPFGPPR